MLFRTVAIAAFAAQALAQDARPYKPAMMKMSLSQMGLSRRQDADGYIPEQTVCGDGETCADACGAGYVACVSSDAAIHCYNPAAAETCCPNNSGDSCQAGYYCSQDSAGDTWCCPNGMSLAECAAKYSASGTLVSLTSTPSSTSTSTSSVPLTTSAEALTTDSSSSAEPTLTVPSSTVRQAATTTRATTTSTSNAAFTLAPGFNGAAMVAAGAFAVLL